jgi:hypothetical protein
VCACGCLSPACFACAAFGCGECSALAFVFVSLLNLNPPEDAAPGEQRTQYLRSPLFSSKPLSEKVREWMQLARSAWAPSGEGAWC